eukprot:436491-Lingulodinium_polyedra.AAC.1
MPSSGSDGPSCTSCRSSCQASGGDVSVSHSSACSLALRVRMPHGLELTRYPRAATAVGWEWLFTLDIRWPSFAPLA